MPTNIRPTLTPSLFHAALVRTKNENINEEYHQHVSNTAAAMTDDVQDIHTLTLRIAEGGLQVGLGMEEIFILLFQAGVTLGSDAILHQENNF